MFSVISEKMDSGFGLNMMHNQVPLGQNESVLNLLSIIGILWFSIDLLWRYGPGRGWDCPERKAVCPELHNRCNWKFAVNELNFQTFQRIIMQVLRAEIFENSAHST